MCYPKPGPRCSGHTRTNFQKAKEALVAAEKDLTDKQSNLKVAKSAEARAALQASTSAYKAAQTAVATASQKYDESKTKRAAAMDAYRTAKKEYFTSPEGINRLRTLGKNDAADQFQARRDSQLNAYKEREAGKVDTASSKPVEAAVVIPPAEEYQRPIHRAPTAEEGNAPIHDLSELYGDDYLESPHYYTGHPDPEMIRQLRAAVGNPDAKLTIYRALPKKHTYINDGDWVALSRSYAQTHLDSISDGTQDEWHIVSYEAPASALWSEGNDLAEWGYNGKPLTA